MHNFACRSSRPSTEVIRHCTVGVKGFATCADVESVKSFHRANLIMELENGAEFKRQSRYRRQLEGGIVCKQLTY